MDARYSKLSRPSLDLKPYSSFDAEADMKVDRDTTKRKITFVAQLQTIWTLILHSVLSLGAAGIVLFYINDHHFNLTERTPLVNVVGGKQKAPLNFLQSDIVTILSAVVVALRCALIAWGSSLIWRVAVFLMERRGLARRDLKTLIHYGVLRPGAYGGDWPTVLIGLLLLALLVANFVSPILTGSISWVPSNQLVHGLSVEAIRFDDIEDGIRVKQPTSYFRQDGDNIRRSFVLNCISKVSLGWGRDVEPGVLKRVSSSIEALAVNSTVENATLPYFRVHSIQWVQHVEDIAGNRDININDILKPYWDSTPTREPIISVGYTTLIPNTTTDWANDPMDATTIHDTRLLAVYHTFNSTPGDRALTPAFPPNAYLHKDGHYVYMFAWVTFSAGVGRCKNHNCIVSSPSTIRNNTPVDLEPHELTFQALALAPVVGIHLAHLNTSLPFSWDNINAYVEAVLVRSYSGAWDALNTNMRTQYANTSYVPSFPSLIALVDHKRVYIWLGTQLLVTLLGVIFMVIQSSQSQHSLIQGTTLAAFYFDTTMIPRSGKDVAYKGDEVLKIVPRGDRLGVKLERRGRNS